MGGIKVGIVGVGNCACSLIQGIHYYRDKSPEEAIGLMHWDIGGYKPYDITVAAAFDIDKRKVGRDAAQAIFSPPNCTKVFCPDTPDTGAVVRMGRILDGFSEHMTGYDEKYTFLPADEPEPDREEVVRILEDTGVEVVLNYLPVGSEKAACFYAECALEAGAALVNCMPVF